MPPRTSFTGSFAATDANNEVVCPLKNHDGSHCRKRCLGEKRYRSMQEHIRRAHPEHYIPKLPATEESFQLMINTAPSERPPVPPAPVSAVQYGNRVYGHERDYKYENANPPAKNLEDQYPAAATAAVALAQLHSHRADLDWDSEADYNSDPEGRRRMRSSIELPPIHNHIRDQMHPFHSRPRELLPSVMARSPERSSTLPPIHRRDSMSKRDRANRPRKTSITHNSRRPKHEKSRSKDHGRRLSFEGRRQAYSAEPPNLSAAAAAVQGKRWEELIEAAASATEADSDRDLTPIPASPSSSIKRASMPPISTISQHNAQSYKASPLARTLTPPPTRSFGGPSPYPSIETSGMSMAMSLDSQTTNRSPSNSHGTHSTHTSASGHNFHIPPIGLSSDPTNTQQSSPPSSYYTHHLHPTPDGNASSNRHSYPQSSFTHMNNTTSSPASQGPTSHATQSHRRASSPTSTATVQIYCASCRRPSALKEAYACTECISGFCSDCVYLLSSPSNSNLDNAGAGSRLSASSLDNNAAAGGGGGGGNRLSGASIESSGSGSGRLCPRCGVRGGRYKGFQVDVVPGRERDFKDEREVR